MSSRSNPKRNPTTKFNPRNKIYKNPIDEEMDALIMNIQTTQTELYNAGSENNIEDIKLFTKRLNTLTSRLKPLEYKLQNLSAKPPSTSRVGTRRPSTPGIRYVPPSRGGRRTRKHKKTRSRK
jgi:hypothetical protein